MAGWVTETKKLIERTTGIVLSEKKRQFQIQDQLNTNKESQIKVPIFKRLVFLANTQFSEWWEKQNQSLTNFNIKVYASEFKILWIRKGKWF